MRLPRRLCISNSKQRESKTLILLGRATDSCIKHTILGGTEGIRGGADHQGALALGYQVLTSPQILHGKTKGGWQAIQQLEWYSAW